MNYSQALGWLYATQLHGIKLGLENVRALLEHFPVNCPRIIHVAGTNGKGSVCAMIDSIARAHGLRTGLYTSPHLVSFRERIRVNGQMIPEMEVSTRLSILQNLISQLKFQPTFFEITTVLGLCFFADCQLDLMILETGMGGRLDATNAVRASVSVLTPISMDHQQWLGPTLEEIAGEKAGILKEGIPAISAPQLPQVRSVLTAAAKSQHTSIGFVGNTITGHEIALPGNHQRANAALAVAALETAGCPPSKQAIEEGLRTVSWPGRFQRIEESLVLDGAHNISAAESLAQTWREVFGEKKATVVLGILEDKDKEAICKALQPVAGCFIAVPVRSPRSSNPAELERLLSSLGTQVSKAENLTEALLQARRKENPILVTGSLFLVGEALALLSPDFGGMETSSLQ